MKRLACLLLVGALITAGCARRDAPAPTACASADALIVDPALFAFLSKARATHHEADIAAEGTAIISLHPPLFLPGGHSPPPSPRGLFKYTHLQTFTQNLQTFKQDARHARKLVYMYSMFTDDSA
jgi:hypothetical protein